MEKALNDQIVLEAYASFLYLSMASWCDNEGIEGSAQFMHRQSTDYEHEQKVTAAINKIVDLCYKENDYTTLNFLQWYIEEQREEEVLMRGILDRIKLIGNGPQSLYYIDQEIERINAAEAKAQAAQDAAAG